MDPEHTAQIPELYRLEAIGSSNDVVLRLADEGAAEHTTVVAREQLEARGGSGPWHAPMGGLWFSTLWRPQLDACSAALLTLAAGLGVREGIRLHTGVAAGLKWPNDITIDGRKLAGVLVEGRVVGHDVVACSVGVGINVNNPPSELPEGVADQAASLGEVLGRDLDLKDLLETVSLSLKQARRLVDRPEELLAKYAGAWTQRGRQLAIDTGYTLVEGTAARIDPDGALVLDNLGVEHRLDDTSLAKFVRVV